MPVRARWRTAREDHRVHVLHVDRAAAPDAAVALLRRERVDRPVGGVRRHDVEVAVHAQRAALAVGARDAHGHADPAGVALEGLRLQAHLAQPVDDVRGRLAPPRGRCRRRSCSCRSGSAPGRSGRPRPRGGSRCRSWAATLDRRVGEPPGLGRLVRGRVGPLRMPGGRPPREAAPPPSPPAPPSPRGGSAPRCRPGSRRTDGSCAQPAGDDDVVDRHAHGAHRRDLGGDDRPGAGEHPGPGGVRTGSLRPADGARGRRPCRAPRR